MDEKKLTHDQIKEMTDSPVTKEMRELTGMNDGGTYANKDYAGRDTKQIAAIKEDLKSNPTYKKYINANAKFLNKQARLNLYRKSSGLRYSKNPLIRQKYADNVSRMNNKLAKEAVKLHQLKKSSELDIPNNTNTKEAIDTMSMATGKPNLGLNPTDNIKSGNNVNSDVFKNKWDGKDW